MAEGTKNLAELESRTEKRAAGATTTKSTKADIKGKIIEFAWKLKNEGYREATIKAYTCALVTLTNKGANILNPESVKEIIAKQKQWTETSKFNYATFYDAFTKIMGIKWKKPKYRPSESIPFIPLESEIDQLIYGCGKKLSIGLQIIKETAMRVGELYKLKWTDIDPQKNLITVNNPEKGSMSGIYRISQELMSRILSLPKKSEFIFNGSHRSFIANFYTARKRLAEKFANPRLLRITTKTLRHWKATTEYHKTRDLLHVKENVLRHKRVQNTMKYIHIEKAIYGPSNNDEYHVKVATNIKEACELVECGFEYVTGEYSDGGKIFRKRK